MPVRLTIPSIRSIEVADNLATLEFPTPPAGTIWTGSILVANGDAYDVWTILLSGQNIGTFYGPGPFGPIEVGGQETLQLVGTNLLNGRVVTGFIVGSARTDDGMAYTYPFPASPAPYNEPRLFIDYGDAALGDVTINTPTTFNGNRFYNNLVVESGGSIYLEGGIVLVRNVLEIRSGGFIHCNGFPGTNAAGGIGGGSGGVGPFGGLYPGGDGGFGAVAGAAPMTGADYYGGSGSVGSGAAGGLIPGPNPPLIKFGKLAEVQWLAERFPGGGGGGGGGAGAGGGGGGGICIVGASRLINNGLISATGGVGYNAGGGNVGGGGGGGIVIIFARAIEGENLTDTRGGLIGGDPLLGSGNRGATFIINTGG